VTGDGRDDGADASCCLGSELPAEAADWLAARPDLVASSYPWWVLSFDGLEGLNESELRAIAAAMGFVTNDSEVATVADACRGDLIAMLAGWPWTSILRQEEEDPPDDVSPDEVVWWLDDLLDLLECATQQQLIEHVRSTLKPYLSVVWSNEDAVRVDVLAPKQSSRLKFRYPFSIHTFTAALTRPFDEHRYAWESLSQLKRLTVEIGYAGDVEQLDEMEVTVTDLVGWLADRISADDEDNEDDEDDQFGAESDGADKTAARDASGRVRRPR